VYSTNLAQMEPKTGLGEKKLKCDYSIQYIAEHVNLYGKCVDVNNKDVLMHEYHCDDKNELKNLFTDNQNECNCICNS
jgi:hypothetical protein